MSEKSPRLLSSIELRYVLTHYLLDHGRTTVAELVWAVAEQGFRTRGRPSKAISDALRWECGRDRARRLGRGRYGPGCLPRSTEYRIHRRVWELRDEVGSRAPGPPPPDLTPVVAQRRAKTLRSGCGGQRDGCDNPNAVPTTGTAVA